MMLKFETVLWAPPSVLFIQHADTTGALLVLHLIYQ